MTHAFSLWAPYAEKVEIEVDGTRFAMSPESRSGRFAATVETGSGEPRYGYFLDGAGPFPDPRSPRLPDGVHGHAQCVDHSLFRWSDTHFRAAPLSAALFYELHIGTFSPNSQAGRDAGGGTAVSSGTFDSAADRLPHLAGLGVTHIELMPVATASGGRGWGYDGVGLYAPYEAYGGPHGLKRFVNRAHELGLAVCLDCVYNHLGPEGNYLGKFGPYFTDHYNTPWGDAVNFDAAGSDEVRAFVLDNLEQWFRDYHIDAIRIDAVHALYDESAVHIMLDMKRRAKRLESTLGKPLQLIAESNMNNPALVHPEEAGGVGLDAHWSDDFHHCVHTLLTGEGKGYYRGFGSFETLAKSLRDVYVHDGSYAPARERRVGAPVGRTPRSRFIHCSQNHDQVGNRAIGERLCHLVSIERSKIAAALTIFQPAVPMLFQGEEWAASAPFQFFTDHQDPGLGEAVTKGRCSEFVYFGWNPEDVPDPQAWETFARSTLDWSEQELAHHADMLIWYRELISLRRECSELGADVCPLPTVAYSESGSWLTARRGRYLLAFTLAVETRTSLPLGGALCAAAAEYRAVSGDGPGWSVDRLHPAAPSSPALLLHSGDVRLHAPEERYGEHERHGGRAAEGTPASGEHLLELRGESCAVVDLLSPAGR